ncbi:MAG: S-layer homology domain-containing protein [Vicinamibacterales bacterium]
MRAERLALGVVTACMVAACATRTPAPPPVPTSPAFSEFMYPGVPQGLGSAADAARVDRGWRYLQNNDLANADLEFGAALKQTPAFYPARAGIAYVALAREAFDQALGAFDGALRAAPAYLPALVGRSQTLLALKRDAAALETLEAALVVDPSLTEVRRRVDVLRFRSLQDLIETARTAGAAARLDEAATAYERALAISPDSAFLSREIGLVARRQRNVDSALRHFRRAADLDPADAASLIQIGELLEGRQDVAGAESAYRRAADIDPSADLSARLASIAERTRDAQLPAEFRAIPASPQIARGDLAALIGVRLEEVLRLAAAREVVVTDVTGHWAASWITSVARAGVIEPFANHTFQPGSVITRADLAGAVSRLVALLAASRPELRPHLTARPPIADMSAGHLSYPAASVAVASGVIPLAADGRFEVGRPVSGAEATEVVARLQGFAGAGR